MRQGERKWWGKGGKRFVSHLSSKLGYPLKRGYQTKRKKKVRGLERKLILSDSTQDTLGRGLSGEARWGKRCKKVGQTSGIHTWGEDN